MNTEELSDVAIVIQPEKDNVAVATEDFIEKGTSLNYAGETDDALRPRPARAELRHQTRRRRPALHHLGRSHRARFPRRAGRASRLTRATCIRACRACR